MTSVDTDGMYPMIDADKVDTGRNNNAQIVVWSWSKANTHAGIIQFSDSCLDLNESNYID